MQNGDCEGKHVFVMAHGNMVLFAVFLHSALSVRINFTSCQDPEWACANNLPNELVYSCSVRSNDIIIHLKDYYTDHITSLTVQNCKDLRVILDCPILQRTSQLQRFKVKDCDRLEFGSLAPASLLQTPPEVTIDNVKEVISLPRNIFKSPSTATELRCLGAATLKKIRVTNSKINSINTKAINNVTGIKSIEFDNVTITDVRNQAIEAIMGTDSVFTITNSRIENLERKGITVQTTSATVSETMFNDIIDDAVNITADNLHITGNKFKEIRANGLVLRSVNTDITQNEITKLKTNALNSVKCLRKISNKKQFNFVWNRIENVEPHSITLDYASCKTAGTTVTFSSNKIDCKCRNIGFLNSNSELYNMILDTSNNNTCLFAPCTLPLDVVKILQESDMCQLSLDPQVMCLLYSDKHNEVTTDEDVTEPAPTLYLIRQANSPNGDASAAMTAVDKDDLLRATHLNMSNRTAIKVVFDSSKDFVETLRSTSSSRKRPAEEPKSPPEEYINRCVGAQCRNNVAYDKQKALDFYKYVYAQLRPPRQNDNKKKKT